MRVRTTKIHVGGNAKSATPLNYYSNKLINFADLAVDLQGFQPASLDAIDGTEYSIEDIETAIQDEDEATIRAISYYYSQGSGIYGSMLRYLATLMNNDFRMDRIKTDYTKASTGSKNLQTYREALAYLDNWNFKLSLPDINYFVLRDGAFYGYVVETDVKNFLMRLPNSYCRSIYKQNGYPIVEFNVKYFDDTFRDAEEKENVVKGFPQEIQKYYKDFANGRISPSAGTEMWCPLSVENATVIRFFNSNVPILFGVVKELIRLQINRNIDDKRAEQQLFKILVQEMPLDKDYNLVFDVNEAKDMHKNTVGMIKNAPGVDVLTTFAKTTAISLNDGSQKAETQSGTLNALNGSYQEAGITPNVMATQGNISTDYSTSKDTNLMYYLLNQVGDFLNLRLASLFSKAKGESYKISWLKTTEYNYKDKYTIYKEGATLGYSKMMPALAIGVSQTEFEANLNLENDLGIFDLMKPLESSYTQNGGQGSQGGAPPLDDKDKQDSTLKNQNGE